MAYLDKRGIEIARNTSVLVPDPNDTDLHNHQFVGTVKGFRTDNLVTVEDGDGDCFDIEADRLLTPIGVCNRTETPVYPTETKDYAGYCPELDEDLFGFEFE